ncbi:MAG TPA: 4,5-DOPA dioxygenase extradiol [Planctomycetota bacterium]|nr:4,5-DOPA dioxygenase extradiol [Planctomycetota bacterium]
MNQDQKTRMPVLFVGHGSPMNAIEDNRWSRGFAALAHLVPRPKAILAVSAHWFVPGTLLTANVQPRTIHDFGGFPDALFAIEYPARGHRDLAQRVRQLLGEQRAALSDDWGLDHGTWSVLVHTYPRADVPVVQLSIDTRLSPQQHFDLARSLAELRDEGVLVLASGNATHNLRDAFTRMQRGDTTTPVWAARFDQALVEALRARDTAALLRLWPDTADGKLSHPTPDHWLPMLYAYGASDAHDQVSFPIDGFDLGSLSMRSVLFG